MGRKKGWELEKGKGHLWKKDFNFGKAFHKDLVIKIL